MKRIIAVLIALMFAMTAVPAFATPDKKTESKDTVKIGFYESSGMFSGSGDSKEKSGYCYDYMMQLMGSTGWDYEFCYGSFSDLYDKLKKGEIDVLPYTNKNDQRAQEVLFSKNAMVTEEYYLAVDPKNKGVEVNGIASLNGAVISTVKGADYNELLKNYLKKNNVNAKLKYYSGPDEIWDALRKGKADATIYTSLCYSDDDWKCICTFGEKPTYVAVTEDRSDLLKELMEAESIMKNESPAFLGNLYEEYFPDNPMRNSLTGEEQAWIDKHPVLHVGCFEEDAPYIFSYRSGRKEATGLTVDVIKGIFKKLNIDADADYTCFESLKQMERALDKGEIDVIIPFYPDNYIAQQHNLLISNTVRVSNMELVYKKGTSYSDAIKVIATPSTRLGKFFVQDTFKNSKIIDSYSIHDAVEKVIDGKATGAIAQNIELHKIKEQYDKLDSVVLSEGCSTCFAARPKNYPIIRIINRGLNYYSAAEISAISSKYSYTSVKAYTIGDFIKDNVVLIIIVLVAIATAFILMQWRNNRRVKKALAMAENANTAKTSFLFNMSHDIRTPMNAITGFTAMAKKYAGDEEKVTDYLDKIDTSGQQLLGLINQVLEMARIESGQIELDEMPVNVQEEFETLVTVLKERAQERGLNFKYAMEDVVHYHIFADEVRMSSITFNLAGNAMKYTPEGGTVEFRLKEIPGRKEGFATLVFTIEDTGIGMSKEFQQKLYEPFAREKNSTVSKVQGTGLGLSIVKNLVDFMGGDIQLQSEPGKGTRFDITVDFRINENEDEVPLMVEHEIGISSLKNRKVLLVEDNELNREIAKDILEEGGLAIDEAEDGAVAVEMMKEKGPDYYDFVLMDIQMPVMDGYEATKAIREIYPDADIPIVAVSANAFEEDRKASKDAGMNDHIAKPIDVQELFKCLAKYL